MRKILTLVVATTMVTIAWGGSPSAAPAKKKAPAKPATATAVKKPGATTTAAKRPAATASAKKPVKKGPATTWRNRQTSPTPDRYKEIQEALVARGYLPSEQASGAWNDASADALKKFQADQTLDSTGKINSLSLIALGLGPRHDGNTAIPVDGNNMPQLESGRN